MVGAFIMEKLKRRKSNGKEIKIYRICKRVSETEKRSKEGEPIHNKVCAAEIEGTKESGVFHDSANW